MMLGSGRAGLLNRDARAVCAFIVVVGAVLAGSLPAADAHPAPYEVEAVTDVDQRPGDEIVATRWGWVGALRLADGKPVWERSVEPAISKVWATDLTGDGNREVLVASGHVDADGASTPLPAIGWRTAHAEGLVRALDGRTGRTLWEVDLSGDGLRACLDDFDPTAIGARMPDDVGDRLAHDQAEKILVLGTEFETVRNRELCIDSGCGQGSATACTGSGWGPTRPSVRRRSTSTPPTR